MLLVVIHTVTGLNGVQSGALEGAASSGQKGPNLSL